MPIKVAISGWESKTNPGTWLKPFELQLTRQLIR
jgi:hypothetical protein